MIVAASIVVLFLACAGGGAAVLHAVGLWRDREAIERAALGFAVGLVVLGWLLFWVGIAGWLNAGAVWAICLVLAAGNALHVVRPASARGFAATPTVWALAGLAAVAMVLDGFEAALPPVDADSLAYHFELPRRFVENGAIAFVPVAFSGAAPLMVHMSYAAILALGGAAALTIWTAVSGWMASVLLFAFSRRWLSLPWALFTALLFQTLPAMVYGAGSGQIEARLALFVLAAAVGLADCRGGARLAPALLVGIGAGAYAAGKFTGLLFLAAAGIALMTCGGARLRRGAVFAGVALFVGGQWYGWNFLHTGDPVFPMLFGVAEALGLANPETWNAGHAVDLTAYLAAKRDAVAGWHWWLSYPTLATLAPPDQIESGRVGLGPYFLLAAPMALWGAWRQRDRVLQSPLLPIAVLVGAYYLLWMQFGGIPKVRHLLPVIPALLLCLTVAAINGAPQGRPMALAAALSLTVNFAAHGLFSRAYLVNILSRRGAEAFLDANLRGYPAIAAINALDEVTRVYVWDRQLQYYICSPTFFAARYTQTRIDGRDGRVEPARFHRQLRAQDISHVVITVNVATPEPKTIAAAIRALAARSCLARERSVRYPHFKSRTLKGHNASVATIDIWRVMPTCATDSDRTPSERP